VFVTAHRIQARALRLLAEEDHGEALTVIRDGIAEVEQIIEGHGELEYMEESPELKFLNQWEKEVEESRPLSPREKLNVDLRAAVEQEKFELAASLRDRIRKMEE
jgi:protein-arginine kinase activator protein McsA